MTTACILHIAQISLAATICASRCFRTADATLRSGRTSAAGNCSSFRENLELISGKIGEKIKRYHVLFMTIFNAKFTVLQYVTSPVSSQICV